MNNNYENLPGAECQSVGHSTGHLPICQEPTAAEHCHLPTLRIPAAAAQL